MGNLEQTLEAMARKAKNLLVRPGEVGEENTKAVLIDPILQALGWDIHDLDEVRREYRYKTKDNPVDYALFIAGKPEMFLEAKPLGADLTDHKWRSQIVNYANTAGVEWCVLTDGNTWQVYKSNAPGDLDRKLFLDTCLYSQAGRTPPRPPVEVLSLLSKDSLTNTIPDLWRSHYVDRTAETILLRMLQQKDASIVRLMVRRSKEKRSEVTKRDLEAWLDRARVTIETSLREPPDAQRPQRGTRTEREKRRTQQHRGLPSEKRAAIPLLAAIVRRGGEIRVREDLQSVAEEVADQFGLTDDQRRQTYEKRNINVWTHRLRWARQRLVEWGLLDDSRRGVWAVTDKGRERAARGE